MFLSHLPPDNLLNRKTAFGKFKLKTIFNPVKSNPPDTSLLIVMVRIIDKVVDQRRIVFHNIEKWLSEKDERFYCLAASYSEDVISDLRRLISLIKAHRSLDVKHIIIEKEIYKKILAKEKLLTNLRDSLEHLDKEISSGKIKPGQDYGLILTETGYQINDHKITYELLDNLILDCDLYIERVISELA